MLTFYESFKKSSYRQVKEPTGGSEILILAEAFDKHDAKYLSDKFGIASHLLDDVFDINELPRVETEHDYKYVYLRSFELKETAAISLPILFLIGKDLFACLTINKNSTAEIVEVPTENNHQMSHQKMLARAIFSVTKRYEESIDKIGDRISRLEKLMRSHEANNKDFFSFVNIDGSLNRAKMGLAGLSTVIEKLLTEAKSKEESELLDDAHLYTKQLLVEIESHAMTTRSIREAYSTVANNNLNQRMKVLTALTLLLAIPNVFFGMYGMNIALPFMDQPWAYTGIVGLSIVVIITVLYIARNKKFF